jgi:glycerophosphoryl diester phosphodiesterase
VIEPTRERPLIVAHRGASGYRPEHTRAAYELAIALGADAIEPDVVATRDGQLVLRHENEISGSTDVAEHPEFAHRRTTKFIDGERVTGWFTEDFTWRELSRLRARERLPAVRQASSRFDGRYPLLRLRDLMTMLDAAPRPVGMVAEIKHATYFSSIGLPLDELFAAEVSGWAPAAPIIVESFEQSLLERVRERGVAARYVFLLEKTGAPFDLVARFGDDALPYSEHLTDAGLARLAARVDGISVETTLIAKPLIRGGPVATTDLVERAHAAGLSTFAWTLRPENQFLPGWLRIGQRGEAHGDWMTWFQTLMSAGVDGVFADHPDLALEARAALPR